ncbi:MAG: hypothetical protein J5594_00530 [Elusimicrobiaceae bacterium]|nr:hypothetical protein [Elusimicrobiaceae bacterium]
MNGTFANEDVSKFKSRMIFLMFPLFIIIGFFVLLFGLSSKTLHCTYGGVNGYACQTNLKIFAFNLGTDNFSNITKAVSVTSKRSGSNVYQMQFVNQSGQNFAYTSSWTRMPGKVDKEVVALNKYFDSGRDFNYTFAREWFLIIFGLFFAGVPILILFLISHNPNDSGFRDFDAKKFLAQKDLSKMSNEEILAFIKQKNNMEK